MGKGESQRISYIIDKNDDYEKEIYLKELGASVHNYIKTGVKNSQLNDLAELEQAFQKRYEERFNVKKIADEISQSSKRKMVENGASYIQEMKKNAESTAIDGQTYRVNIEKVSNQVLEIMVEVLYDNLKKVIKDTAYMSHMNMLYELYEQEERLRREEAEYEKISEKYHKIADIAKNLSEERRMNIERLQKQADISEKDLTELVSRNKKFFNLREKKESVQISLSPSGKKYYDYVMNSQEKYSKGAINQLVYKNCDKLMTSLKNSYDRGIELELKLEEISSDKDRALQVKYHRIMQKFISENEEVYTAKGYIIREEKESVYRNNEKNRIRIPKEWVQRRL